MALGGVATGSMNAMAADNAATAMSVTGAKPSPAATPAMMGIAIVDVALLEVTSVRKTKSVATKASTTTAGTASKALMPDPIQFAKPDRQAPLSEIMNYIVNFFFYLFQINKK